MTNNIIIQICNKDRPSELVLLLQSLRTQTLQNFNIVILDDGSTTPLTNFYFVNYMINRLKYEGHGVKLIRNNIPSGVSKARQQLVDYTMKNGKEEFICRIDDDSICDSYFLEKLMEGIEDGFDLVGCIVPPFVNPNIKRDTKFVKPIIGYCEVNNEGNLVYMGDDCGHNYLQEEIIPSAHFRSSALYKKEIHNKGVDYDSRLSKNGFLEEAIFSFKCILKGFKIGIHTGAICRHLITPSGGERDTMDMQQFNMSVFLETVKKMYVEHGDFLEKYYKKLKIDIDKTKINYKHQNNLMRK